MSPKATHRGWFLFCPVWVDMTDDACPGVWARWWWLEPLLSVAHAMQATMIALLSMTDPYYEPAFMLKLTGEVDGPHANRPRN